MPQSIKIDDALYETIRADSARSNRSLGQQAELYIRIGRAIHRSPDFNQDRVDEAAAGGLDVGELTLEEQEAFFASFREFVEGGASQAFYQQRRLKGLGVGESADGRLVRQVPGGGEAPYSKP